MTGRFRTVRTFCRTQKLCWNVKNKGSFDVAKTKKCNFLVILGKKLKMFLLIVTLIFNIFVILLAPVDRAKCLDSKTTPFFESSPSALKGLSDFKIIDYRYHTEQYQFLSNVGFFCKLLFWFCAEHLVTPELLENLFILKMKPLPVSSDFWSQISQASYCC